MNSKPTIGILGAGKLGTTLGRLFINAGYPVLISGSKEVEKISLTIDVLVPGAIPTESFPLIEQADIIILAIPLSKYQSIPNQQIENKLVIDATNYWFEVDGMTRIPEDPNLTSSELIQDHLSDGIVIKAFNHMGYHDLEEETFSSEPKVIAVAGNDSQQKEITMRLVSDIGFEPLDIGNLNDSWVLEPGSPLFGANLTKTEFINILKQTKASK